MNLKELVSLVKEELEEKLEPETLDSIINLIDSVQNDIDIAIDFNQKTRSITEGLIEDSLRVHKPAQTQLEYEIKTL
jgi:hypothetical protein